MSHFAAMKSPLPVASDTKSPLFCPKPRRPVAPLRCHQSGGFSDAGAGVDLLDLLLSKGEESGGLMAASPQPPLFCGSPPRRASNPVVHDSRFGMDYPPMPVPLPVVAALVPVARPNPRPSVAPSMSPRGASCARARFAFQPAAVRVEGFDCLDRSRGGRGHGITAMA